ncbi:hypothetical protein HCN44_008154 [Aphidius gifuensis]|uniref:Uncharacterized protein n=1 Tax=Aphidius gifuensis TaxID=684658 RepID=A0A835CQT2_APHGI|nr:hypothetical protein HCN44_008154 [Aphidius gifuensis]
MRKPAIMRFYCACPFELAILNLLSWQGLLGGYQLKKLALSSLLNKYLLAGLRIFSPVDALNKANIVMSTLTRAWLKVETIEMIQ